MNHYLRFPNQQEFRSKAGEAGLLTAEGNLITATHSYAIDEVGIVTEGGSWDPQTNEVIVLPTILEGWHVNMIGSLPDGWDLFLVNPKKPFRVWSGFVEEEPTVTMVRARNELGQYIADNPDTPDINEAWIAVTE